jgi:hypothetical protein
MPPKAPKLPNQNNNGNAPQGINYKLPPRPGTRGENKVNQSYEYNNRNSSRDKSA